ncbi:MAG: NADH-quinone oxidoreductase subunit NuoG [Chloroflexota bacterium]
MENEIKITVDGRDMQVPKGQLLWEACKDHGIDIPIFCYHTKLGPVGACRTCLVEVEGITKGPITACSTPVTDGMVVRTRSPIVEKAQRGIFEFLLANHPLDCPICDRAGECPLQDQTFSYGPGTSRYIEPKRHHVKPVPIGPTVALDRERCVLCWRCVRFCAEVAEDKSIVLQDRGDHTSVGTFQDEPYVSNFSGNVIELCPVGALTSRKQRFNFRPWELRNRPSVCPHCPVGCNINVSVRKNDEIIRFLSRDNPHVDDSWLCDRGRFDFEFVNSPERIASPMIRREQGFEEVSWGEALDYIAARLQAVLNDGAPDSVVGVASPRLTNEDLFVFKQFFTSVLGSGAVDHFPRPQTSLVGDQARARQSLDRRLGAIDDLDGARTIVLLGADPSTREPVLELRIRKAINRGAAKLVVIHPDELTLSGKADATIRYPRERLSDACGVISGAPGTSATGIDSNALEHAVQTYLQEGPLVVLYDDSFEGVEDKGEALAAVAALVDALATKVPITVLPMLDDCNSMGARDLGIVPSTGVAMEWGPSVVSDLLSPDSQVRAAFVLGANLANSVPGEATVQRLGRLELLVVHELFMTETAACADVILPAASFAEKAGSFTNTEGRIQALRVAVPTPGVARADWQILVDLSQYFDNALEYSSLSHIWEAIRSAVPAYSSVDYGDLGERGERPSALVPA